MDKFYEQLLTTQKSITYTILNILRYVILIAGIFYIVAFANIAMVIFGVVSVGVFFLLGFLKDRQYKEYEYTFTNGNLQIDVIYGKKKRKNIFDEEVKTFDDFGKESEVKIPDGYETVNCIPWDKKGEAYVILSNSKEKKKALYVLPDENLLKLINLYHVRKVWR